MGCSSTEHQSSAPALHRDFAAPLEMGSACKEPGNANFQGKNYRFSSPFRHSAARPPSGRQILAFGHICLPDVLGRGTEPLWMGKLPTPFGQARLGMQLCHITPALEKRLDGTRSSGKEGLDGTNPASQMVFIQFSFYPVAGGAGNETQPGYSYRDMAQYGPVCPSKDRGLNLPRALGGVGAPGEANWTYRGCWCPWDPGSRMGMWDGDVGCRGWEYVECRHRVWGVSAGQGMVQV